MLIQPYLMFEGRCEEAFEFYRQAIGAELVMQMRYKDSPVPPNPDMVAPGSENKIMHMCFRVGKTEIMASDGCNRGNAKFDGFSLTLSVASDADAQRVFAALGEGGQVRMPLGPTFFSSCFGMLVDRFGVGWMVIVTPQ